MEVMFSFEISVAFQWTIGRYIPEHRFLHNHWCGKFKSHKKGIWHVSLKITKFRNNEQQTQTMEEINAKMYCSG
jgi:hypothetical protein